MATVVDLIANLRSLNLKQVAEEVISRHTGEFTEFNKQQLSEGKSPDGGRIGQYAYNKGKYARYKNALNPKPGLGFVDLILTGAFRQAFATVFKNDSFFTDSSDEKSDKLQSKYGPEHIFGLTDEHKESYSETIILPDFQGVITSRTGLTFNQ